MRQTLTVAAIVTLATVAATGVAVATASPDLDSRGEGAVTGTSASAVFSMGDRTIRQIRYVDGNTLAYTFTVDNDGWMPLQVTGLREPNPQPRLFEYQRIVSADGQETFTLPARGSAQVTVELLMRGCETLSARAGSFVTEVELEIESAGVPRDTVTVEFPEEVRAGSPREAGCANATAGSRPPG